MLRKNSNYGGIIKHSIYIIILGFLYISLYAQEDPQFSQHLFNQMYINPGYAGNSDQICLNAIARTQWMGWEGAPTTVVFSGNAPFKLFRRTHGVGLNIFQESIGFEENIALNASYAYKIDIADGKLSIGASVGFINEQIKPNWTIFNSNTGTVQPYSPTTDDDLIPTEGSAMALDIGAGLFYNTDNLYLGLSSTHVYESHFKHRDNLGANNRVAEPYLIRNYYVAAGYNFQLSNPLFEIIPSILIQTEGKTAQAGINLNLLYNKRFWGGVSYRPGDAVIGMLGIQLLNGLKIGYAYDFTTSQIRKYSDGSHEVSLGYCFSIKKEKIPQKYKSIRFL